MKKLKKFFKVFLIILVVTILGLLITGNGYIIKALVYNYANIDDLNTFEKRIVYNGAFDEWPLSHIYNKRHLPAEVDSQNIKNESVEFLVVKNDSIVYEQYWDGYEQKSISNSFSVAKSIVGILTGIAINDKLFALNDRVGRYIPAFNQGQNARLKIIDLLKMSSGLDWDEAYASLFSKTTKAYYGDNLEKQIAKLKVVEPPGIVYRYMSCNTLILASIISRTSGKTLSDFASEKLWKPIGATQAAYWSLDHENGIEKSYCCFYSTARDFAKIGKLMLDSGRWNGKQIVPVDYVLRSIRPNGCIDENGGRVDFYGLHWWLTKINGKSIFYARGIMGQYIIVIPQEKIIIVRLGKKRGVKNEHNQYDDMISYTTGVLNTFGTHLEAVR